MLIERNIALCKRRSLVGEAAVAEFWIVTRECQVAQRVKPLFMETRPIISAEHPLPRLPVVAIAVNRLRKHMLNAQSLQVQFFFVAALMFQCFKQQSAFVPLTLVDWKFHQVLDERRIVWPAFAQKELTQIFAGVLSNRFDCRRKQTAIPTRGLAAH